MDGMYGMLFNSLSIEKRLRTAVTSNMLDTIAKILEEGGPGLVNTPLYQENKRTAMHLACEKGSIAIVQLLVDSGGDVNAMDLFGYTPLTLALRSGKHDCAQVMLRNSSWHPASIWQDHSESSRPPCWTGYPEESLCLMLIGTPNVLAIENVNQFNFNFFMELCEKYQKLTRAFYLTGNQLPQGQVLQLYTNSANLGQWIRSMLGVQSLQHYAKIAVRRNLKTNVFYGAKCLPLPVSLQNYLTCVEDLTD